MPRIFEYVDSQSCTGIEFPEFIQELESLGEDIFIETNHELVASLLQRLYRNRTFLCDTLRGLLAACDPADGNPYDHNTFILHRGEHFSIRAPVWDATSALAELYDHVHDHNFNFYTLGYFGGGYWSETWTYQRECVVGYPGERVELANHQKIKLHPGHVMFYRKSVDVHRQIPPSETSISINILEPRPGGVQFEFDEKKSEIVSRMGPRTLPLLFEISAAMGTAAARDKLWSMAQFSDSERVRLDALTVLAHYDIKRVKELANDDRSILIRNFIF